MSGTNAVAVKKELIRRLGLESGLSGVQVVYLLDARDIRRECVYGGKITGPVEQAAMRPVAARSLREEHALINVHVRVLTPGGLDSTAEERAAALAGVVFNVVAADPTLAGAVPGLLDLAVVAEEYECGPADDTSAIAIATLQLLAHSMLT